MSLSNLRSGVGGSAREMQEFVTSLKGRSAADAMGIVAKSHLVQALIISFVIQAAIVLGSAGYSYATRDTTPKVDPIKEGKAKADEKEAAAAAKRAADVAAAAARAAAAAAATQKETKTDATTSESIIPKNVMNTDAVKPGEKAPRDVEDILNNAR